MRLYRVGDSGESVRDIQSRLDRLGFTCDPDSRGEFRSGTRRAVRAFQRDRGLPPDGIVGPDTWRMIVEAGYALGARLLYLRRPMLRGDDVADLQRRLNELGFDADKVDGIFGPNTDKAVHEFQHNRGLPRDGVAGPLTVGELKLVRRNAVTAGREAVREREWMRRLPSTVLGLRLYIDPACRDDKESVLAWDVATALMSIFQNMGGRPILSREADVQPPERIRARRANRDGSDLNLSLQLAGADEEGVLYFQSSMSHSEAGRFLAERVGRRLDLPVVGRATPFLKDTRAPAIVIATDDLHPDVADAVIAGLQDFVEEAGSAFG